MFNTDVMACTLYLNLESYFDAILWDNLYTCRKSKGVLTICNALKEI